MDAQLIGLDIFFETNLFHASKPHIHGLGGLGQWTTGQAGQGLRTETKQIRLLKHCG